MNERKPVIMMANLTILAACIALSEPFGMLATVANAQTPANTQATTASLPPGMVDVVGLTKAGFSEDGILAKVKKAGVSYDLTTEQMIYLKNQGVSENVISALLSAGPATTPPPPVNTPSVTPPPPPSPVPSEPSSTPAPASTSSGAPPEAGDATATAPPPGEPVVNADYVQDQLTPYGSWVDVPGYGRCWQPSELPNGWRPYYDGGHWVDTDAGLYWQSDYPWGAVAFHYGRWTWAEGSGWVWVPGYEYAPAWVFWRHADADGYVGWAPLPYGAVWVAGGWWEYRHARFAVDYDFGFGPSFFVFVGYGHLWEPDYHRFILRGAEFHRIFARSEINRLRRDEHGRFVHDGLDRGHLEHLTGQKVEERKMEEVRGRDREAARIDHDRVMRNGGHSTPRGKEATGRETPSRESSGKETSGRATLGREASSRETPARETPTKESSGRETTGKETPTKESSGRETPRKETSGKETPGKGEQPDKGDKKNQPQSKSNTNQHFAQLKGSSGS